MAFFKASKGMEDINFVSEFKTICRPMLKNLFTGKLFDFKII